MFTESDQIVSREECIEAAAESLARCIERVETDMATAPAEARAV